MSAISRTEAWCKLAVLIADGMPAPRQFALDRHGAVIVLETADDFAAWVEKLGLAMPAKPFTGTAHRSYTASGQWCGTSLVLSATLPLPSPEPVAEDMTKVREIAGAVSE